MSNTVAAYKFLSKRNISRSHGSSVRKLIRADRIRQGQRPLVKSTRFTMAELWGRAVVEKYPRGCLAIALRAGCESPTKGTFARLHPTKGLRFGNAI